MSRNRIAVVSSGAVRAVGAYATLALLFPTMATAHDDLRQRVEALISASGAEVAVAMRTLDRRDELLIDVEKVFHAASTMKVAILVELYRQQRSGEASLDEPLPVKNQFASIVDRSAYSLDPAEDSDLDLYQRLGGRASLRELAEAMITKSSNLATNLLIERLGVDSIRRTVAALGAQGLEVVRGVEDILAFRAGRSNTTTAGALLVLFERLARGEAVDPEASREMVEVLLRQVHRGAIPAGLPPGTRVANKTGNITGIHHDAAIVYAERPFVLVVLVRGIEDEARSSSLIAAIAHEVFAATQTAR